MGVELCACYAASSIAPFDECEGGSDSTCLTAKCTNTCEGFETYCNFVTGDYVTGECNLLHSSPTTTTPSSLAPTSLAPRVLSTSSVASPSPTFITTSSGSSNVTVIIGTCNSDEECTAVVRSHFPEQSLNCVHATQPQASLLSTSLKVKVMHPVRLLAARILAKGLRHTATMCWVMLVRERSCMTSQFHPPDKKKYLWLVKMHLGLCEQFHRRCDTTRFTSIDHPQIGGKFTATPGGPTSVFFLVARTSSVLEPVLPIIKYAVAPLEVGPEFAPNKEVGLMRVLW